MTAYKCPECGHAHDCPGPPLEREEDELDKDFDQFVGDEEDDDEGEEEED